MAEAIGLDYLTSDEKIAYENQLWQRFEAPARAVTLAASIVICASEHTLDWLHTDEREVRDRLLIQITKPRTLPRPTSEAEELILAQTFGPDHASAEGIGRWVRAFGADEFYAWLNCPADPKDPAHINFVGGYRPERPKDVDKMLKVIPKRQGREILAGRAIVNPSVTGRPQLCGYTQTGKTSEELIRIKANREHHYYYAKQSEGGASRREDRRIVMSSVPQILWSLPKRKKGRELSLLLAEELLATTTAVAVETIITNVLADDGPNAETSTNEMEMPVTDDRRASFFRRVLLQAATA